jgi:phage terminase small subunit
MHELFARAFVAHGASFGARAKAAREAGYDNEGGSRALKLPQVRARIAELLEERHAELDISGRRVMQELAAISFAKVSDLYDENGDLIPPYNLPEHVAAAISGMDVEMRFDGRGEDAVPYTIRKYRFVDKNAALGTLAKHFKIVGTDEDGVNALASILADKLKAARHRRYNGEQPVEDATIIPPKPAALPQPVVIDQQESDDERLW